MLFTFKIFGRASYQSKKFPKLCQTSFSDFFVHWCIRFESLPAFVGFSKLCRHYECIILVVSYKDMFRKLLSLLLLELENFKTVVEISDFVRE